MGSVPKEPFLRGEAFGAMTQVDKGDAPFERGRKGEPKGGFLKEPKRTCHPNEIDPCFLGVVFIAQVEFSIGFGSQGSMNSAGIRRASLQPTQLPSHGERKGILFFSVDVGRGATN